MTYPTKAASELKKGDTVFLKNDTEVKVCSVSSAYKLYAPLQANDVVSILLSNGLQFNSYAHTQVYYKP